MKKIVLRTVCLQPLKAFESSLSRAPAFKTLYGFNWFGRSRSGDECSIRSNGNMFLSNVESLLILSNTLRVACAEHQEKCRFPSKHPIVARGNVNQTVECANVFRILSHSLLIEFFASCFGFLVSPVWCVCARKELKRNILPFSVSLNIKLCSIENVH